MDAEKVRLLVGACINFGHLGFLNLEDQELVCLYDECLITSQYFEDIVSAIQLCIILSELTEKMHCVEETSKYLETMLKLTELEGCEKMEALALTFMATRYRSLCDFQKAIDCHQKIINISRKLGEKEMEGSSYGGLAYIYNQLGKKHVMKECAEQCVKLAKETGDKVMEGKGHLYLGTAYSALGNWKQGISFYEKTVEIALQTGETQALALEFVYSNLGFLYKNVGNFDQAQMCVEKALEIGKEKGSRSTGDNSYHYNLGSVCRASGKYQEAINHFQKGLSVSKDIGDKYAEARYNVSLGDLYWEQGKFHAAMECLHKGLKAFNDIGNRRGEGEVYGQIALVYANCGKIQECIEYLEKSLEIAIETGNKKGQVDCYANLGLSYQVLHQHEKALEYHVKSLNCNLEIGNKMGEGKSYSCIGSVYLDLGNPEEAIKYLKKSLEIATSNSNDREGEGMAYYRIGRAYFRMKKYDEAVECLERSLDLGEKIGQKSIAANSSHTLGMVNYDRSVMFGEEGDEEKCQDAKRKSEEMLKEALQCWEWQFTHLRDLNDFKISIVDSFIHTYKMLTKVLIERQKTDEALLVSDRGRARSLGDILVSKYGMTDERAPSQTPLHSTGLESVLSSNQYCILFFAVGDKGLHAWVLTHQQPMVFVNDTIIHAVKALQLEEGHSNTEQNLQEMTTNVVNAFYCKMPREMETAASENRSFNSTRDLKPLSVGNETRLKNTGIKSGERNGVSDGEPQNEDDEKTDELEDLYSLLIAPVIQHLQHEEIVIIPDGPLFMVPFAALRDPTTGEYLSETKSIRILPSLATLKALQECTGDHHSKTGALIVGNPEVGEVMFKGETKTFDPLPSAEQEADSVANVLNVKPLIGSQATKEMVKQKLRDGVAVIHIAAHGDSEHGHIALAPPPRTDTTSIPEEQDYMLTMQEVQEIGVTAQLVVLSCCHSGRGDIKAEGVVGMSRAFLAAGARAVVASLWAVDDYATSRFMASFYASFKMGESASKSLQIAMEDIRDEEGYEDPMFWAPFFLIGADVTISG